MLSGLDCFKYILLAINICKLPLGSPVCVCEKKNILGLLMEEHIGYCDIISPLAPWGVYFCNLHSRSTWLHTPTPGLSLDSTVFSSVLLLPDFWRARSLQPTLDYWLLYILYTDPMHPSLWTCAFGRTVYGKKMAGMAARPTSDIRPFCGGEGAEEG